MSLNVHEADELPKFVNMMEYHPGKGKMPVKVPLFKAPVPAPLPVPKYHVMKVAGGKPKTPPTFGYTRPILVKGHLGAMPYIG